MLHRKTAIAFVLAAFSFLCSFAQKEKLDAEINAIIQQFKVVGLSVAVVKHGEIIYANAFGMKDIDKHEPLATQHIFRIASISKSFSATSIMQLVEAGKLSLSDDFGKLVGFRIRNPKYPETVITLKMVLSHTSSINDSQEYFNFDVINPDKNPNWQKCYNDYEPGKGYQYCNLNFNMVGAVIERASGERFDNYVKRHILDPLGLYAGYCVDSLDSAKFATLYEYDSAKNAFVSSPNAYAPRREEIKNYVMGYSTPIFSPTGGMKISASDLARYMMVHMNKGRSKGVRIIRRRSSKLMQTNVAKKEGYGLAISNTSNLISGKMVTGHTGSAYGLYSAMFFQKREKFGIVIITNGCNAGNEPGFKPVIKATAQSLYDNLIK